MGEDTGIERKKGDDAVNNPIDTSPIEQGLGLAKASGGINEHPEQEATRMMKMAFDALLYTGYGLMSASFSSGRVHASAYLVDGQRHTIHVQASFMGGSVG